MNFVAKFTGRALSTNELKIIRADFGRQAIRAEERKKVARYKPRRLAKATKAKLVDQVARIMKAAKDEGSAATLLNFEGPCRHAIRSKLILKCWGWQEADDASANIVASALSQIGAIRPDWDEGQPEWAQSGAGGVIERTRCIHCHKPLPRDENRRKFCSDHCASVHVIRVNSIRRADETRVYKILMGGGRRWTGFDE